MYTVALEPYVGKVDKENANKQPNPHFKSTAPFDLVVRLVQYFVKTGRNLTGDNWFTSIPLVQTLLELKTTYVGTVRKNKREVPSKLIAFCISF